MKGDTRCIDGRLMRHDPQLDDPDLETDVGQCEACEGKGRGLDCPSNPVPDEVVRAAQVAVGSTFPPLPPERRRSMTCPHCGGELRP